MIVCHVFSLYNPIRILKHSFFHPKIFQNYSGIHRSDLNDAPASFVQYVEGYLLFFPAFLLFGNRVRSMAWGETTALASFTSPLCREVPGSLIMPDHSELRWPSDSQNKKIPFLLITKYSSVQALSEVSCKYLTEAYEQHIFSFSLENSTSPLNSETGSLGMTSGYFWESPSCPQNALSFAMEFLSFKLSFLLQLWCIYI